MDICLIGGDTRMGMLAETAAEKGNRVICCGMDMYGFKKSCLLTDSISVAIKSSRAVILPLPVTRDGINLFTPLSYFGITIFDIVKHLKEGQLLLGGMISPELYKKLSETGATVVDYFAREELNILNAISTVEGVLEIAMHETDFTIFASNVLIVGYGRLGRVAADRFSSMGANVTVSARKKSDLAWIKVEGYNGILTSDIEKHSEKFDIIINTVPNIVISKKELESLKKECLIIDLASLPGGVDFDTASRLGIKAISALSLPGKVAPRSAASVIYDTLSSILDEHNI